MTVFPYDAVSLDLHTSKLRSVFVGMNPGEKTEANIVNPTNERRSKIRILLTGFTGNQKKTIHLLNKVILFLFSIIFRFFSTFSSGLLQNLSDFQDLLYATMTLAIISISYDATVLIMLIPEFWEYGNISTTKSDRARPAVRRPDFKQGILR